jgi:hypothetical protein
VSYDRAHKHTWAKRKVHVDQCHYVLVIRTCSECGMTDETEVERDFHKNPLQICFAREDCGPCRRLAYGIEPASWGAAA